MKIVPVQEAVGSVLCHDITAIAPGQSKGRAFKKGHVVREEYVPRLLDLGKAHLFVWESRPDAVHEDEAAMRLARAVAGEGLAWSEPVEGKVKLRAATRGLLLVDAAALERLNGVDEICVATLHGHQLVEAGDVVGGCRVVPLAIDRARLARAEAICAAAPIVRVRRLRSLRVGIVTTGGEVYAGRIADRFGQRPHGPYGAAGVGEAPLTAPHPAILNAIYNACGARVTRVPARPAVVLEALAKARR